MEMKLLVRFQQKNRYKEEFLDPHIIVMIQILDDDFSVSITTVFVGVSASIVVCVAAILGGSIYRCDW